MASISCHEINSKSINDAEYKYQSAGCLILSTDNKLVLQLRDAHAPTFPHFIATFGGGIETGETPLEAIIRELNEELGAMVLRKDIIRLGTISEPETNHQSIVHMYFWHDKRGSITGCYEGSAKYINDPVILDSFPKVMNDVIWAIDACKKRRLIFSMPRIQI